jgi:Domain of unknown function (DUF4349)
MRRFKSLSALLFAAIVGCEGQPLQELGQTNIITRSADEFPQAQSKHMKVAAATPPPGAAARPEAAFIDGAVTFLATATQPGPAGTPAAPSAISRKIIYDAQVDVIVNSVEPTAKRVTTLVQDARGYIAEQNITGSPGTLRSMRWKIRIPVEQFDSFVESLVALGELERNNRTSQDVSDQYYDIEARIKNKKVEEQTLNKILQERSGKLEDVLKVEVELSRVRGETEQLEGKIRVLENLSALATLTLNIRERDKYAPPPPVVADFATQIARAWDGSLKSLVELGKSVVLWAVTWAIWIPFYVIGALVAWIVIRWLIRVILRNRARLLAIATTPIVAGGAPRAGQ